MRTADTTRSQRRWTVRRSSRSPKNGARSQGAAPSSRCPRRAKARSRSFGRPSREDPEVLLREVFGHSGFRPHQAEVVRALIDGTDALLVMPTGAGKSLCYQLPGLARGGTTLVVSPLIALMEDQVAKLQALGLRAERIHSGRARTESREVCREYLRGELDFLFIAPNVSGSRVFQRCSASVRRRSSRSTRRIAFLTGATIFARTIGCSKSASLSFDPRR